MPGNGKPQPGSYKKHSISLLRLSTNRDGVRCGKIVRLMNARPENPSAERSPPPQLIQSLTGGFNAVANNIYLILLPAALDLLLWFGPHLRMKTLIEPVVLDFLKFIRQTAPLEMRPMWDGMENLWQAFLNQFNLVSMLSTFPIGVPALMVSQSPLQTPMGAAPVIELTSVAGIALIWLGLCLAGLGLGTFYFAWVVQGCARALTGIDCGENNPTRGFGGKIPPLRPDILAWQGMQILAIVIMLVVLVMVIVVPSIFLASFLALISPFLAQAALIFIMFSAVWFLVPLVFSPHGIFLCGLSVINSMLSSARVVRYSLPGTGTFLLTAIILNQGLGVLWRVPPEDSWLTLVGIFGHAFIATGLLAASFIYYRGGLVYVQSLRNLSLNRRGLQ